MVVKSKHYKLNNEYKKEHLELLKFYNPTKYHEVLKELEQEKLKAQEVRKMINEQSIENWKDKNGYDPDYHRAYYIKHKKKIREYQKSYNDKNRAILASKRLKYYKTHKKDIRQAQKRWYKNNRAHVLSYGKKYRDRKRIENATKTTETNT